MTEYNYGPEHISLMKEQVWEARQDLLVYNELSDFEFNQFRHYLPVRMQPTGPDAPKPIFCLEMGCGIGRGSVQLFKHYGPHSFHLLVDRQGFTENLGIMYPEKDEYYNDFNLTNSFVERNGMLPLVNYTTFDSEQDDWSQLDRKFDLVTSRCAMGFHFPVERYIDKLIKVSSLDVTMIFGMNFNYQLLPGAFPEFKERHWIEGQYDRRFPHQNWLVLRGLA